MTSPRTSLRASFNCLICSATDDFTAAMVDASQARPCCCWGGGFAAEGGKGGGEEDAGTFLAATGREAEGGRKADE